MLNFSVSLMLALGVPDKYAMQRLGHATPNMLKTVYQYIMDDKSREVDASISQHLNQLFNINQ